MAEALIGPVLADILSVSEGKTFTLASAFYSEARLDATTIRAQSADILVRLNLRSIDDWVSRAIAPDALLRFWQRHPKVRMNVYCSPGAHAKIYSGDSAFLVGSANFTVRGLSGTADEVLWYESERRAYLKMKRLLTNYKAAMAPVTISQLSKYVEANVENVKAQQKKTPKSPEDSLPPSLQRPARIGSYDHFLQWLSQNKSAARTVTLARANGSGQLSGHIRMNFYGLRQFLLANPTQAMYLCPIDPNNYRLCNDSKMENDLKRFVMNEAIDEGGLKVDIWRTYLPMRSGGKPKSGGGTSGNLNRMLPLMASYLFETTSSGSRIGS